MRLNLYVKSLPNFMHNDDEQLRHATPHNKQSLLYAHSLDCVPSFYVYSTHIWIKLPVSTIYYKNVNLKLKHLFHT
jgi:hypothetical protein